MTPIPDYKPSRQDEAYEGAMKISEWATFVLVAFLLWVGLFGAAIVGDELQQCRIERMAIPAGEPASTWDDYPSTESLRAWRKLDGRGETWE